MAKEAEKRRRRELELGFNGIDADRAERVQRFSDVATAFFNDYCVRAPKSETFAKYSIRHLCRIVGKDLVIDINADTVKRYQIERLKEGVAPKTINEEVSFLLRALGEAGDAVPLRKLEGAQNG